jgi:hypothetical protein
MANLLPLMSASPQRRRWDSTWSAFRAPAPDKLGGSFLASGPGSILASAEVLKQEAHTRRYGNDLKRAIVDYAFARQDESATIARIAEELGLSAWLLGKWLRHARLRLEKGKIPFEPGEPLPMPWLAPKDPAAE